MFITELEKIYLDKPILNELINSKLLLPNLRQFFIQEIRLGSRYLNPYRFAYKFGYSTKDVIQLFIAFSQENGPLKRVYKVNCSNCGELNLIDDKELINYSCSYCEDKGDIEDVNFLENVTVVFEIKEKYIDDAVDYLKALSSSEIINAEQHDQSGEDTLVNLKEIILLSNEFKKMHNITLDDELDKTAKSIKSTLRSGLYK